MAVSPLAVGFLWIPCHGPVLPLWTGAAAARAVFIHPAQFRAGAVLSAFENPIANFSSVKEALKNPRFLTNI